MAYRSFEELVVWKDSCDLAVAVTQSQSDAVVEATKKLGAQLQSLARSLKPET